MQWSSSSFLYNKLTIASFWTVTVGNICDWTCENRSCGLSKFDYFSNFVTHNLSLQYGMATQFSEIVHNLTGFPNATFQYWDITHQITWYILAHVPCFCRPGHICNLLHYVIHIGGGATWVGEALLKRLECLGVWGSAPGNFEFYKINCLATIQNTLAR